MPNSKNRPPYWKKLRPPSRTVDTIGRPALFGNGFSVTADEMVKLKTLAKKSVNADKRIADANTRRRQAEADCKTATDALTEIKAQRAAAKKAQPTISENINWFNKIIAAMKRAPKRLMAVIEDILHQPPEQAELGRDRPITRAEAR